MAEKLPSPFKSKRRPKVAAALLAVALSVAGCSNESNQPSTAEKTTSTSTTSLPAPSRPRVKNPKTDQFYNPTTIKYSTGINCDRPVKILHGMSNNKIRVMSRQVVRHAEITLLSDMDEQLFGAVFVGQQNSVLDNFFIDNDFGWSIRAKENEDGFEVYQSKAEVPANGSGGTLIKLEQIDDLTVEEATSAQHYTMGDVRMKLKYQDQVTAPDVLENEEPLTGPGVLITLDCLSTQIDSPAA